ncbi:MAG: hypothetical protein U9P80_09950 [Thermodesulfobacteriota bacterium]|nr:hypothetical protein [Thermodesulfobacteriota bacterium]
MTNNTDENKSLFSQIGAMGVSEKLDLARKGSKEARTLLMRDSNKIIQMAVISSPKITDSEAALIAGSRQVKDEVLRYIATKREWARKYPIRLALINNPKTPLALSIKMIPSLSSRDLGLLSKNKSVPRALSNAAESRSKGKKR